MSARTTKPATGVPSGGGAPQGAKRKASTPPPAGDETVRYVGTIVRSRDNGSGTISHRATNAETNKRYYAKTQFHVSQCLHDMDGAAWSAGYKAVVGQRVAFDIRHGQEGRQYAADITSHPDDGPVNCVAVAGAATQ